MCDTNLFWCPKSNQLFIPKYDVTSYHTDDSEFIVGKYRPCRALIGREYEYNKSYPWFEAVDLCDFGTWGSFGWTNEGMLKTFTSKSRVFKDKRTNDNFLAFRKQHPEFKNAKFAEPEDSIHGIPREAITEVNNEELERVYDELIKYYWYKRTEDGRVVKKPITFRF